MNLFAKVKHYFLTQYMSLARVCSKCDENKLLTKEFYHADSKGSEGFSAQCKLCRNSKKRKVHQKPDITSDMGIEINRNEYKKSTTALNKFLDEELGTFTKVKRKTLHEPYKNLTLSETKKIRIHPEPEMIQTGLVSIPLPTGSLYSLSSDLKAFARVHDRLLKHFGRMYWMKVEADGTAEIRAYGKEHSEQFRGRSILEVINNIFSS